MDSIISVGSCSLFLPLTVLRWLPIFSSFGVTLPSCFRIHFDSVVTTFGGILDEIKLGTSDRTIDGMLEGTGEGTKPGMPF